MKDTAKKTISAELEEEVYRLWAVEDWSYERISSWLLEKHQFSASREWVRRLLERKKEEKGGIPDRDAEPEELEDDQQLHRLQCALDRAARKAHRMGDLAGLCNAAKAHVQVVLARKRLKEEAPSPDGQSAESPPDPGVKIPLFQVTHGRA